MEKIWKQMYKAAIAVQKERQISDYVSAGGVAAAVLSKTGKFIRVFVSTLAVRSAFAQNVTQFLI